MYFAQNLKILMEEKGISNYQLAKEAGCHQSNIPYWIEGERHPQKRMIQKVAEVLDVHPIDITDVDFSDENNERRAFSIPTAYEIVTQAINKTVRENQYETPLSVNVNDSLSGQKQKSPAPEGAERIPGYSDLSATNKAIVDSMIAQLLAAQLED